MSTREEDWELLAAEYVLGTLNDQDRKACGALYKVDENWRRQVQHWRTRLNPLNATTPAVEPPPHILPAILAHIGQEQMPATPVAGALDTPAKAAVRGTETRRQAAKQSSQNATGTGARQRRASSSAHSTLNVWRNRVRYWQFATALAVASAVGVFLVTPQYLAQRMPAGSPVPVRTVAVLQSETDEPLWTVTFHSAGESGSATTASRGSVSITAVGDPQLTAAQSHQLWMVLPEGAGVQSVGLVPDRKGETVTLELPIALEQAGEFAVSLEPLGGVPGPEHGPVVARTFIITPPNAAG